MQPAQPIWTGYPGKKDEMPSKRKMVTEGWVSFDMNILGLSFVDNKIFDQIFLPKTCI